MSLSFSAGIFLLITCVVLPWMAVRGARRVSALKTDAMPSRGQYLMSVAFTQGVMLILALARPAMTGSSCSPSRTSCRGESLPPSSS